MASKAQLALRQARALEEINFKLADMSAKLDAALGIKTSEPELEPAEVASAPEATKGAVDLAAELGVDLSEVSGTGADGKIIKSNVADFAG